MIPTGPRLRYLLVVWLIASFGPGMTAARAQEHFEIVSVNSVGCDSGTFGMTALRANFDGGNYVVRTRVQVGADVFMKERAPVAGNGVLGWSVFDRFTYGIVPNRGAYPINAAGTMRLDFTLERPKGIILSSWTLIVDSCATGNILYNAGPILIDGFEVDGTSPWSRTVG